MSRAILDSSADTPQAASGGFADLHPLDQELASQLPAWDLVPPHSFLVRKPKKPKSVPVPLPLVETAVEEPAAVHQEPPLAASADEIAEVGASPSAEAPEPEAAVESEAVEPVAFREPEVAPSLAAHADQCSQCGVPLEPGSLFCPECGHRQ